MGPTHINDLDTSSMTITPLVLTGSAESDIPSLVTVHPVSVASILDHHLRRPRDDKGNEQDRVIGTLMGTRDEAGQVQVLSAFGVPFGEVEGRLLLDTDALRQQLDIVVKASPKLSVVGWYATSPQLNSWTPLIHDEYANLAHATSTHGASATTALSAITNAAQLSAPIHLTLDVASLQIKAYASEKLGLASESANRTFVPLKTEMKVAKNEQAGLELLTKHAQPTSRPEAATSAPQASTSQLVAPLVSLNGMLGEVAGMLDSVLSYVKQGKIAGDAKIGRYLLETLASVPLATTSKGSFDEDFNSHLADLLMVSYLANVVRVNLEVSARASMLHDARLAPRAA